MPKTIPFTKEGLARLEDEQTALVAKRKLAVTELTRAREMGDLSENGLYKAAKGEVVGIDRRLRDLRYLLQRGRLIAPTDGSVVDVGCSVVLSSGDTTVEYMIVGEYEADPKQKKISRYSPLGKALLGKKVGDQAVVQTPGGEATYTVVEITA